MSTSRIQQILYTIAALISLIGLADAIYLTVLAMTGETAACGDSTGCFQVLGSKYASIGPWPVAAFGVLAYLSAFSFAVFAVFGYPCARIFFGLIVWAMLAATSWLLFVQAFLLHAFCRYCLVSATIIFLLTGLVVVNSAASRVRRVKINK